MPKILVVGTESFEFPEQGENADYGEQVTDWAVAVTDALTTVQQPNDILPTQAIINNNQTSFTNIAGFSFDVSEVLSINAEYIIRRSTTSPSFSITESGTIRGNYNGSSWSIAIDAEGDAGMEFDITNAGQLQYKTSNIIGSGYVGFIIFKAKVINQA